MYSFTFIIATQGTTLYGLSKNGIALLVDMKESKTVNGHNNFKNLILCKLSITKTNLWTEMDYLKNVVCHLISTTIVF